jgi:hypothetical protein
MDEAFLSNRLTFEEYINLIKPESLLKIQRQRELSYKSNKWWIPYYMLKQQFDPDFKSIWKAFNPTRDGYMYYSSIFGYNYRYDCKEDRWEIINNIPKCWMEISTDVDFKKN